jgi:hypothetical protein
MIKGKTSKSLDEGLLRKTDDGYVFVGKYEDLYGKKKKKPHS